MGQQVRRDRADSGPCAEWSPGGVTVNAVAPTWVYTPGTADRLDDPRFLASVLARIPAG